jgi:hypothetical protein
VVIVDWMEGEMMLIRYRVRALIEKLVKTIEPSARLLAFGSSQNSFGLRNSGMSFGAYVMLPQRYGAALASFRCTPQYEHTKLMCQIWTWSSSLTTHQRGSRAAIWCR